MRGKYAAVEHYRRYASFLRSDLSDTPMNETTALAGRIKNDVSPCLCPINGQRIHDDPLESNELSCHSAARLEGAGIA